MKWHRFSRPGAPFVLAPYLRGFRPTSFRDDTAARSGQQAALGQDLIEFMDVMKIDTAILAGYDWGGRQRCLPSVCLA